MNGVSLKLFLLAILIVSIAVSAFIQFSILGISLPVNTSGRNVAVAIGGVVGGAFSLALIPAVIASFWRLLQKLGGRPATNGSLTVASIAFVIVAFMTIFGVQLDTCLSSGRTQAQCTELLTGL